MEEGVPTLTPHPPKYTDTNLEGGGNEGEEKSQDEKRNFALNGIF